MPRSAVAPWACRQLVLPAGRAVTLYIPDASALAIHQGRVWATFDGPHQGPANDLGNVILAAGERLSLHSGQRVVIESWSPSGTPCSRQSAYFSLEHAATHQEPRQLPA